MNLSSKYISQMGKQSKKGENPNENQKKPFKMGFGKIVGIFIGVLVLLLAATPLAPFVTIYFIYDRRCKYKEKKLGIQSKLSPYKSVNEWAN